MSAFVHGLFQTADYARAVTMLGHKAAEPDLPDVVYIEQLTSALYLEARADVDHYQEVMNRLSAEALTPAGSTRFIKQIISQI